MAAAALPVATATVADTPRAELGARSGWCVTGLETGRVGAGPSGRTRSPGMRSGIFSRRSLGRAGRGAASPSCALTSAGMLLMLRCFCEDSRLVRLLSTGGVTALAVLDADADADADAGAGVLLRPPPRPHSPLVLARLVSDGGGDSFDVRRGSTATGACNVIGGDVGDMGSTPSDVVCCSLRPCAGATGVTAAIMCVDSLRERSGKIVLPETRRREILTSANEASPQGRSPHERGAHGRAADAQRSSSRESASGSTRRQCRA